MSTDDLLPADPTFDPTRRCTGDGACCPCQGCLIDRGRMADYAARAAERRERVRLELEREITMKRWSQWARAARRLYGSDDPRCLLPSQRKRVGVRPAEADGGAAG